MTPCRSLPRALILALAATLGLVGDVRASPAPSRVALTTRLTKPSPSTTSASRGSAAITAGTTGLQPLGIRGGAWSLKFDDEFTAGAIDLTKWQPNWLAGDNTSITPPANGADLNCIDPAQVSERAGMLHITVAARSCLADNGRTYSYAGGLVNTSNSYQFTSGYAEARIDVPATSTSAPANFPAFWADGTGRWPATGELDVMEALGACSPGLGFHFHSNLGALGGCAALPMSTGWHTFGADWQAGVVTYYYDGVQVGQITRGITGSPMYLILNNSIDPAYGGPTSTPADLRVDYVRVWQSATVTAARTAATRRGRMDAPAPGEAPLAPRVQRRGPLRRWR